MINNNNMEIPDLYNPIWKKLVLNRLTVNLNFLAAKMLLTKIHILLKDNQSFEATNKAVKELYDLYYKHKELPNVKKDIEAFSTMN